MKKNHSLNNKWGRGFSLIEILVAISIIAILSMVVMASLEDSRKKSRDTARSADMQQLAAALQIYGSTYGRYPSSSDGACAGADSFGPSGCLQVLVTANLFTTLPQDPTNSESFIYQYDNSCVTPSGSNPRQYRAWAIGERVHQGISQGWNTDETIGVTTCQDPQ